nr:hypothetical protein [Tanacetum cinerariifolium]
MHNNIMAAVSRDRPPMLATGRCPQWRLQFLRYTDTRPNGEALRKCNLSGPYKPTTVLVQAVEATDDSPAIPEHTSDPEQAQRDKDMQNNLALIAKCFKKIYKPTSNNLRTSSNSRNKNVDTIPRYKNDDHSGQFKNQRTVNVTGARKKKPKRVKDSAYHMEKMQLCKQAEKGVSLQVEQYDWLANTDEEVDEQELEAHYSYMAKIQEVPTAETSTNSEPVEQNEENDVESDDERVALANLKLDVDENKKIQKQLKKANTTLAQELKECKAILTKTSKSLGESISVQDSFLVALQTKQAEFEKYKAFNDRTIDYNKLERRLNETLNQLAQKDIERKEGLKTKAYELSVVKEKHDELMKQSLLTKSHYEGLSSRTQRLIPDGEKSQALERESRSKLNKDSVRPYDYTTLNSLYEIFKPLQPRNMEILIQTCLMPLAIKTLGDSLKFVHELKQEMHADL